MRIEHRSTPVRGRNARFGAWAGAVGIAVLAIGAPPADAQDPGPIVPTAAVRHAWIAPAPDGRTVAERLILDPSAAGRLAAAESGGAVRFEDWPIAPGVREVVTLVRRDVYAPDAIVWVVGPDGPTRAPRSRLSFFFGEAADAARTRVLAVADPDSRTLRAYATSGEEWMELRPEADAPGEYLLAPTASLLGFEPERLSRDCGLDALEALGGSRGVGTAASPAPESGHAGIRAAVIAFDTDNELLQQKFSDNTVTAGDYIATLVGLMSVVYERDLDLRLLQGTTFLRPSSTPDPYFQSGTGNADGSKLNEFRQYWVANYGSVSRASAMMISGKQGSGFSSSGIAYVNTYCDNNFGYSFNQVFKFAGSTASNDTFVMSHELGHSAGSFHTHCYLNPTPIDTCYAFEGGCYSGTTTCPAPQTMNGVENVRGTLMSYCHLLSGCSVANVFHPRSVGVLDPIIDSKTGVCVAPVGNPTEASPAGDLTARRAPFGSAVIAAYTPACGATQHTVYVGNLDTLASGGIAWTQRFCSVGSSGSATFAPTGNFYFVIVGNNLVTEGSYGRSSSGEERPPAGGGGSCSYTQDLSGACP